MPNRNGADRIWPTRKKPRLKTLGFRPAEIQTWLTQNNLALMVSRAKQRLQFQGSGGNKPSGRAEKLCEIFQLFQGDLIRGVGGHQIRETPHSVTISSLPCRSRGLTIQYRRSEQQRAGSVPRWLCRPVCARGCCVDVADNPFCGGQASCARNAARPSSRAKFACPHSSCHGVNYTTRRGNSAATNAGSLPPRAHDILERQNGRTWTVKPPCPTSLSFPDGGAGERRVRLDWDRCCNARPSIRPSRSSRVCTVRL